MSLDGRMAHRTRRCAELIGRAIKAMDFIHRPEAEKMPLRIIAAPEFLALATDVALGVQFIIAAVQLMQFELEQRIVARTSDLAVLPELLHDPMRLLG
jgi:hypothetical protein